MGRGSRRKSATSTQASFARPLPISAKSAHTKSASCRSRNHVASLLQQVFVDVVTQTLALERSGFVFVPAGTRDNSPALQCWDDGCSDPFESRQGRKRSDHCLSSLTGLCDFFCLVPSTEVLGYFQSVPHGTQAPLGLTTIVSSIGIVGSKLTSSSPVPSPRRFSFTPSCFAVSVLMPTAHGIQCVRISRTLHYHDGLARSCRSFWFMAIGDVAVCVWASTAEW